MKSIRFFIRVVTTELHINRVSRRRKDGTISPFCNRRLEKKYIRSMMTLERVVVKMQNSDEGGRVFAQDDNR